MNCINYWQSPSFSCLLLVDRLTRLIWAPQWSRLGSARLVSLCLWLLFSRFSCLMIISIASLFAIQRILREDKTFLVF